MGTLLIFGAAVVVFVVIMPIVGTRWEQNQARRVPLRRAIAAREITPIAALRAGEVARVRGVVVAREPLLTSPSSGRACIGYRVVIDDTSHDPSLVWIPLVTREAWSSFLVKDETGSVIVEGPLDVAVDPSDFASNMNIPPSVYALLKEDDVRMKDLWGPRTFWCRETLLKVGRSRQRRRTAVAGDRSRGARFVPRPAPVACDEGIPGRADPGHRRRRIASLIPPAARYGWQVLPVDAC